MKCLRLEKNDFIEGMPLQIISTGVPFLMAPVKGMAILRNVRIDRSLLQSLLERIGADAVYTFCLEGFEKDAAAYGRLLTSAASSEDSFTGGLQQAVWVLTSPTMDFILDWFSRSNRGIP